MAQDLSSSCHSYTSTSTSNSALLSTINLEDHTTSNLSTSQRKLLNIHYKMGHLNFTHIQQLIEKVNLAIVIVTLVLVILLSVRRVFMVNNIIIPSLTNILLTSPI
jgi:hypothetical protein